MLLVVVHHLKISFIQMQFIKSLYMKILKVLEKLQEEQCNKRNTQLKSSNYKNNWKQNKKSKMKITSSFVYLLILQCCYFFHQHNKILLTEKLTLINAQIIFWVWRILLKVFVMKLLMKLEFAKLFDSWNIHFGRRFEKV